MKKFREFRVRVPMNEKGEITGFLRLEGWHFISQRMRNGEVQELKTPHLVARQDTEDATYCGHSLFEWTPTKPGGKDQAIRLLIVYPRGDRH